MDEAIFCITLTNFSNCELTNFTKPITAVIAAATAASAIASVPNTPANAPVAPSAAPTAPWNIFTSFVTVPKSFPTIGI